jgi:5-methylcytosine-specific restriction endonuclease McrA
MAVITTRHREKLQKEKYKEDTIESHSCVCAHCGRQFPGENEIDTSVDTDLAESEDNS